MWKPNNLEEWKREGDWRPIHIFSNHPYNRVYTKWRWHPQGGCFGFIAFEKIRLGKREKHE